MHNNPANQKCLVSTHRRGIIKQEVMSREKALGLSGDDVDLQINVQTGEGTYKTKEGKRQKFPSLGTRAWKLFWDAAWAAGDKVVLKSENHINALVCRLRRAFGDDIETQHFFITCREPVYSIRWNPRRSWRVIEALPAPAEEKKEQLVSPDEA